MLIGVTGASGFLGRPLINSLRLHGYSVRGSIRNFDANKTENSDLSDIIPVGNIGVDTDWKTFLGVKESESNRLLDCIIHCAGRSHIMNDVDSEKLQHYRTVNVEGSRRLAEMAANAGVRRFIYLSSIKVNGERTHISEPFCHHDFPKPEDAYGISKWEAEQVLQEVATRTGLELVIVRPPMIYGPGVKANLLRLLNAVYYGVPLPFGSVCNARSLIGLDNLIDVLIQCAIHPRAVGQTFLVADGEDVSTPGLLRIVGKAMNRSPRLFNCPKGLLLSLGQIVGRGNEISRMVDSLRVNISHVQNTLGWVPTVSMTDETQRMIDWYATRF